MDLKNKKTSNFLQKDLVLTINRDGSIVKYNNLCEKTFGYNKESALSHSFFDLLVPRRHLKIWEKTLNSAINEGSIKDFKLPISTQSGHELMVSWSSFPVKDDNDKVVDISIVGRFISAWDDSNDSFLIEWQEIDDNSQPKKDFDDVSIEKIKIDNQFLKDENRYLKKILKRYINNFSKSNDKHRNFLGSSIYRISDIVGGKKRNEELNALMKDLDERESYLDNLEEKLMREKRQINLEKVEFTEWRKRLEKLESEIESKRKWVQNKEEAIEKYSQDYDNNSKINESDETFSPDTFNKINDSAAVIQRGVFKKINSSFADLLGYNSNEIIDKSIFDFIEPEGLSGVEEYYFNRLKGENVSDFDTMFLTKENSKISVEVSTKPIVFQGEKAEIVILKKNDINKS